jgi:hypothetical protein
MRLRWTHPATVALLALAANLAANAAAAPVRLVVPPDIGELPGLTKARDVVQFQILNKDLVILTSLQPTGGTKRVQVEGLPGSTRVSVLVRSRPDMPLIGLYFRLTHADPENETGPNAQTTIYTRPGYVEISRVVTVSSSTASVTLTQRSASVGAFAPTTADDRVTLRIRRVDSNTNEARQDVLISAASMVELMRHAPRETAEHLGPIFRTFGQEGILAADLQLAWQVLADLLPADPAMAPAVRGLLTALDDDDFRRRDAASAALRRLGGPAALALMRAGGAHSSTLSPEQRSRVAAFLADYQPLPADECADRRHDPHFLLTCLAYSTEPVIRHAAAEALQSYDTTGKAREVASIENPDSRVAAADALRQALPPDVTERTSDTRPTN